MGREKMKVSYHGHSVVYVEANGKRIIIDPFITGNENCDLNANELEIDVILLTHGHNDHVGDTVKLAKRNNALVVATFELATYLSWQGVRVHGMSIGGSYKFDFGTVKFTQAFHGSAVVIEEEQKIIYTGMPAGIVLTAEGKTIYHAGDTALFGDMKLIGVRHNIDLAFLPIGDNFTMGPEDAALAAEWLQAQKVVPIHFNTFPVIEQDAAAFAASLRAGQGLVLKPGEVYEL